MFLKVKTYLRKYINGERQNALLKGNDEEDDDNDDEEDDDNDDEEDDDHDEEEDDNDEEDGAKADTVGGKYD